MSQTLYNILKKYSYIHRRRDLRINKSNGNVNNDTDDNNNTLIGCTLKSDRIPFYLPHADTLRGGKIVWFSLNNILIQNEIKLFATMNRNDLN